MSLRKYMLLALSLLGFILIVIKAYLSRETATEIYGTYCYYLILILFLVWVGQIASSLWLNGFSWKGFLTRHWAGLLSAALLAGIVHQSIEPKFRVLSDETNLVAISQAMLYRKTPFNNTQQKRYFGNMNPVTHELEKRPMMFPFFIHLLHLVRGYKAENAFLLNNLVFFALLSLAAIVARNLVSPLAAVSATLLIASYPLVTSNATSGGFDLFATFFTALVFVLSVRFMKRPNSETFATLWVTLLVFSQIRYESSVFFGLVALGLLVFRYVSIEFISEKVGLYMLSPFLLLPLVVQRILIPQPYENAAGTPAFSFDYFTRWVPVFFDGLTNFGFQLPHNNLLSWLAVPILVSLGVLVAKKRLLLDPPYRKHFLLIATGSISASLLIFFSYYFGDYTHPASARFFITLGVCVALLPIALRYALPRSSWLTDRKLLAFSLASFILYHPVSVQGRFTNIQTLIRETDIQYEFLRSYPKASRSLVITSRPGQIVVFDIGAVDFAYANNNPGALLTELKRHLYDEIIVVQRMEYQSNQPMAVDRLSPEFELETLQEIQSSAAEFVRVSRVRH